MLEEYQRRTFDRLLAILNQVCVELNVAMPVGFEAFLWEHLVAEEFCKARRVLEQEGLKPKKAYFVVTGHVLVLGYAEGLPYTESIYRRDTIVAQNDFMKNRKGSHTIVATKGSMVWSISQEGMQELYKKWPEMRGMALQTALNYLERKKAQRNALLALSDEDRMWQFYQVFEGLLPPRDSPVRDKEIAAYLSMSEDRFRWCRRKLRWRGLLVW